MTKVVNETIENEAKEKNGGCFGTLLGALDDRLLGNLLQKGNPGSWAKYSNESRSSSN